MHHFFNYKEEALVNSWQSLVPVDTGAFTPGQLLELGELPK